MLGSLKARLGVDATAGLRAHLRNRSRSSASSILVDRLLGVVGEVVNYPDGHRRWLTPVVRTIEPLLEQGRVSAVLSSSSPVTCHVIASTLRRRYPFTWVADLRDLWSQNHNYGYSALRRRIDRRLEVRTLRSADALITASEPWADRLRELHVNKRILSIPNGFDPAQLVNRVQERSSCFTIAYTGNIYPGKQDPRPFFMALKKLLDQRVMNRGAISVRFFTPRSEWLDRQIIAAGLGDSVSQDGTVPHSVALERQRSADVLLLLNWEDPKEKGTYPLKVFEYLAAKRPIIAIGGSGDDIVSGLLNETRAGRTCTDAASAFDYLSELGKEFRLTGGVQSNAIESKVRAYGYDRMTERFADVLKAAGVGRTISA
jgi:glycosyltransferase involved in cell wall biosynthesis